MVVDFGCGPGAATLTLARQLQTRILAVDLAEPFLEALRRRTRAQGLDGRIATLRADFGQSGLVPASIDLLWSEGAIYHLGWSEGLKKWSPLVRPGGYLALTEATWLTQAPSVAAQSYWNDSYPGMGTLADNLDHAKKLGLEPVTHFVLPADDWWGYYRPVQARMAEFEGQTDPEVRSVLAAFAAEITMYQEHGHEFGYVFYILRRPGQSLQ